MQFVLKLQLFSQRVLMRIGATGESVSVHVFFRRLQRKQGVNRPGQLLEFVGEGVAVKPLVKPGDKRIELQTALEAAAGPRGLVGRGEDPNLEGFSTSDANLSGHRRIGP